jgi:hypothetical protein
LRNSKLCTFCSGQIDAAHFQPTEVGFVTPAEGFSPAGNGVQHVVDYNNFVPKFLGFRGTIVVYAVIAGRSLSQSTIAFIKSYRRLHDGAVECPILIDISSRETFYNQKTPLHGFGIWGDIRKEVNKLFVLA